jgi:hypothetical protein
MIMWMTMMVRRRAWIRWRWWTRSRTTIIIIKMWYILIVINRLLHIEYPPL